MYEGGETVRPLTSWLSENYRRVVWQYARGMVVVRRIGPGTGKGRSKPNPYNVTEGAFSAPILV